MSAEFKLLGKHERLAKLASSYVPEWRFDEQNPDAGSVVALLIDDMLNHTEDNFSRVMDKHKIQYLNLFDLLVEEPIASAKSYVKFTAVTGSGEGAYIPKATTLLADDGTGETPITFETDYAITTTEAKVEAIFVTDKQTDRLGCLYNGTNAENIEGGVGVFDLSGDNETQHLLLLGFKNIFDDLTDLRLGLSIETVEDEDLQTVLKYLTSEKVSYKFVEPNSQWELPQPTLENNMIWLNITGYQPQLTMLGEEEYYVLVVDSSAVSDIGISNVGAVFSENNIPAQHVSVGGIEQNKQAFHPFGNPLEIYAECGIESGSVLSRRGAVIDMTFNLGFDVVDQELPQYEVDEELKIVMKKQGTAQTLQRPDVKPDNVIIEYLSEAGWKRLLQEEHLTTLFNGSEEGNITISFKCPTDMASPEEATDGYRLRMRLLRADNLYSIPNRVFCPVISELNFSYSYETQGVMPDIARIQNNFEIHDITDTLNKKRNIKLFYNKEAQRLSMYFGFDKSPVGSPTSFYFEVQNSEDIPINYTVEYLNGDGFHPIQTVDYTGNFLYSGNILMLIPTDTKQKLLFGKNLYWIRLVSNDKTLQNNLPRIYSITPNMVRVHNYRSRTQEFYLEEEENNIQLQLTDTNLIKADVFVNEYNETEPDKENWIQWTKRSHFTQRGRHYTIDLTQGTIEFDKNIFAAYPISKTAASIRVVYQAYEGSRANVEVGAIDQTEQSLKYVSSVINPVPAYGGYDGYNVESSSKIISNILKTRGRAVTAQDYFDIISQISYCVKQTKSVCGIDKHGNPDEDLVTVALLIEEYEKGNHIFSSIKDSIHKKLLKSSNILPMGKNLMLTQPQFIPYAVKIWIGCNEYDDVYELQSGTKQMICEFIDPLRGGFDGNGWEIGVLPTVKQLVAYIKMKSNNLTIIRISASAVSKGREVAVSEDIEQVITNPFAIAVNAEHTVYVEIN